MNDFEQEVLKRLTRIESYLMVAKPKKTRVKANVISSIINWKSDQMRSARINGYVKFKQEGGKYWYEPDSIHAIFLKANKQ